MATPPHVISLGSTVLEAHTVREVVEAVLHTIIYARALGVLDAAAESNLRLTPALGIVYRTCGESGVNPVIEETCGRVESILQATNGVELLVSFYEKRERSALFGLSTTVDRIVFENWRWHIRALPPRKIAVGSVLTGAEQSVVHEQAESTRKVLMEIAVQGVSHTSHLPHVPMDSAMILPFAVMVDVKPSPQTPVFGSPPKTSSPSASPMLGPQAVPRGSVLGPSASASGSSPGAGSGKGGPSPGATGATATGVPRVDSKSNIKASRAGSFTLGDVFDNVLSSSGMLRRGSKS